LSTLSPLSSSLPAWSFALVVALVIALVALFTLVVTLIIDVLVDLVALVVVLAGLVLFALVDLVVALVVTLVALFALVVTLILFVLVTLDVLVTLVFVVLLDGRANSMDKTGYGQVGRLDGAGGHGAGKEGRNPANRGLWQRNDCAKMATDKRLSTLVINVFPNSRIHAQLITMTNKIQRTPGHTT
jgi:hypothetical protein